MKTRSRLFLTLLAAGSLLFGATSCEDETPEDVQGPTITITNVTDGSATIAIAEKFTVEVALSPDNQRIQFSSSNSSIFTVGASTGLVTGVSAGSATLTVTNVENTGVSAKCTITVMSPEDILVTSIEAGADIEVHMKRTLDLNEHMTVLPANAFKKELAYEITDGQGTIDTDGVLTPGAEGTITVKASSTDGGNVSTTFDVTVLEELPVLIEKITVNPARPSVAMGSTLNLKECIVITPLDASNQVLEFTTTPDNGSAVTIDEEWVLTPDDAGKYGRISVTASATDGSNAKVTFTVDITTPATGLEVNSQDITVEIDQYIQLSEYVTISPSNVTEKNLDFTITSGSEYASFVEYFPGRLKGNKAGTVVIEAKTKDGSEKTASITVTVKPVLITQINSKDASFEIYTNQTLELKSNFTVLPTNATNKAVTYSVDDSEVATIDANGKLTPSKAGTVTVTATAADDSGISGTCMVEIKDIVLITSITCTGTQESPLQLTMGNTLDINDYLTIEPEEPSIKKLTYTIGGFQPVTVNADGIASTTRVGLCNVVVKATDGSNVSVACYINVVAAE